MQRTTTQPGSGLADSGPTVRRVNSLDIAAASIGYNRNAAGRKERVMSAQRQICPHRPAHSAASGPPELRPGRRLSRLSRLLPVFALLLGALWLPVAAQTPAMPTDFKVSPGNASFFVKWGAVTGANSYLIEWDGNTATGFGKTAAATPGAAKRTTIAHSAADPVVNGTLYKARVRACSNVNPVGAVNLDCSAWTATLTVTPGTPSKPWGESIGWGDLTNELGNTIRVDWEPSSANGSPITGYDVHYTTSWAHSRDAAATATYFEGSTRLPDPAAGWVEILRQNRRATSHILYGIPYGTFYRVRIRAVNAVGAAEWEETGYGLAEEVRAPHEARNVRVASGDGKLTLTWEAPSWWGTWSPGGYEVQWKLASAPSTGWSAVWTSGAPAVTGPDATRFEFTGQQQGSASVTNGVAYDLRIRGWNKRPGTDGSAAYNRSATPVWDPAKVTGTPAASQPGMVGGQSQLGAGEPPVEQVELPNDDGEGENVNDEPQPVEQEAQPEEQEPQQQQAKDAALDLTGTDGNDNLQGGDAGDVLAGKKGDDVLRGLGGNDELRGGKGNDELRGGRGGDTLYGGSGDDRLHGDRGADRLLGGNGDDTFTGGPGADRFVFFSGETGDKIITDFGDGNDQIVLRTEAFAWPPVADIIAGVVAQGDRYLVYTLSPGLTVETDTALRPEDYRVK